MTEENNTTVEDEASEEDVPFSYSMTSWGADYALETLVSRLQKDIIFVPPFQRGYVWKLPQASKFIESLLLGLPVPGVFLYKEETSGRLLIVDGQQRLQTIRMFFEGMFNGREFALTKVSSHFDGKTYNTLTEEERNNLNDTIIHSTIVRQDAPKGDNSSVYQIFERLNTGGTQLAPQEIRSCIFYGEFSEFLGELNEIQDWRDIFGAKSSRMKDQELILRFLAFRFDQASYARPLNKFLNDFMEKHREDTQTELLKFREAFFEAILLFSKGLGSKAFRPRSSLNAAVFDSMMVGLSQAIACRNDLTPEFVARGQESLFADEEYLDACSKATGDASSIEIRFRKTMEIFRMP
jgi:uncharacterized protein with ParB-like and HNH nuclease domain